MEKPGTFPIFPARCGRQKVSYSKPVVIPTRKALRNLLFLASTTAQSEQKNRGQTGRAPTSIRLKTRKRSVCSYFFGEVRSEGGVIPHTSCHSEARSAEESALSGEHRRPVREVWPGHERIPLGISVYRLRLDDVTATPFSTSQSKSRARDSCSTHP
jgi:hypothetical protein